MAQWVYSYRCEGSRSLTDREQTAIRQSMRRCLFYVWLLALSSILLGIGMLVSISVFAVEGKWGFAAFVAVVAVFLYVFSRVSVMDRSRLLYRRALRRQQIETFVRSDAPESVRAVLSRSGDEEDLDVEVTGDRGWPMFWESEERLLSKLTKICGKVPDRIELLAKDGVILIVEGSVVRQVINVPVVSVEED